MGADTYEPPRHGWTCFYCGETFKTVGSAADHFGNNMHTAEPGCLIDYRVQVEEGGKPERGRGLLMALRKVEAELARYREEDTNLHRQIHGMQSAHNTALMREEEKGYARGLRDGVNLPADSPERASVAGIKTPVEPNPIRACTMGCKDNECKFTTDVQGLEK